MKSCGRERLSALSARPRLKFGLKALELSVRCASTQNYRRVRLSSKKKKLCWRTYGRSGRPFGIHFFLAFQSNLNGSRVQEIKPPPLLR